MKSFISHLIFSFASFLSLFYLFSIEEGMCTSWSGDMNILWTNEFWEKREVRFVYLLYTIGSIVCLLLDRGRVCVIKLIVVFIYIRWHTNELSSCATSFPLCKHHRRLAVNVKGTNNVINVISDGSLSLSLAWRCREIW